MLGSNASADTVKRHSSIRPLLARLEWLTRTAQEINRLLNQHWVSSSRQRRPMRSIAITGLTIKCASEKIHMTGLQTHVFLHLSLLGAPQLSQTLGALPKPFAQLCSG